MEPARHSRSAVWWRRRRSASFGFSFMRLMKPYEREIEISRDAGAVFDFFADMTHT